MSKPLPCALAVAGLSLLALPPVRAQAPDPAAFSALRVTGDPLSLAVNLPGPTETAPAPIHQVPAGLLGGTARAYDGEAWNGLFTAGDGAMIAATTTVLDKARDGIRSSATAPAGIQALNASLVYTIAPTSNAWPTLTSWVAANGTVRGALRQQALPALWDFAARHPFGVNAEGLGPALYWLEKAAAALPPGRLDRAWTTGIVGLRAGVLEITSTDRPRHHGAVPSDFRDYLRVWLRRTATAAATEGLAALIAAPGAGRAQPANPPASSLGRATPARLPNLVSRGHPSFPFVVSYAY